MPTPTSKPPTAWTPRRIVNVALSAAAAIGGAVVHLFFPGAPWAALALALAAGVLLGLAQANSPLDAFLDRVIGPDTDAESPPPARMTAEDERAIRDALQPPPRPRPRKIDGSAALDVLGAVVSFGIGLALLIARGL
jgi:hypothetical protein